MGFVFPRCWGIVLRSLCLQSKHVNMLLTDIQSRLNSYGLNRSVVYMFVCSLLFKNCLPKHHHPQLPYFPYFILPARPEYEFVCLVCFSDWGEWGSKMLLHPMYIDKWFVGIIMRIHCVLPLKSFNFFFWPKEFWNSHSLLYNAKNGDTTESPDTMSTLRRGIRHPENSFVTSTRLC